MGGEGRAYVELGWGSGVVDAELFNAEKVFACGDARGDGCGV